MTSKYKDLKNLSIHYFTISVRNLHVTYLGPLFWGLPEGCSHDTGWGYSLIWRYDWDRTCFQTQACGYGIQFLASCWLKVWIGSLSWRPLYSMDENMATRFLLSEWAGEKTEVISLQSNLGDATSSLLLQSIQIIRFMEHSKGKDSTRA